MQFESLINMPLEEHKIVRAITNEVQSNFYAYQKLICSMKIDAENASHSKITFIRTFQGNTDFCDYIYDTKFCRCCAMLRYDGNKYRMLLQGFHISTEIEIHQNSVTVITNCQMGDYNREETPMPPRELIEGAFREITDNLIELKSNESK